MKWEKWYFQKGEQYPLSEVINECDRRIRDGLVIRRESKNNMVRRMEKCAPPIIRLESIDRTGLGCLGIQQELLEHGRGKPHHPTKDRSGRPWSGKDGGGMICGSSLVMGSIRLPVLAGRMAHWTSSP
jgi:hypothetical protein